MQVTDCSNSTHAYNTQKMVEENKAFLLQLTNFLVDEKRQECIKLLMNDKCGN